MSASSSNATKSSSSNNNGDSYNDHSDDAGNGYTMFQMGLGLLIVGTSAGMTLYTKKTHSMLNQLKRVEQNRKSRLPKEKFGPKSKEDNEKMKSRWTDDDL